MTRLNCLLAGVLVMGGVSCAGPVPSTTPEHAETATAEAQMPGCTAIDLRNPTGDRIDLTGTWVTESWTPRAGTYYLHQIGECLWWAGGFPMVADDPNFGPTGNWKSVFRGVIGSDFTIVGDWTDVRRECQLVTVVACHGGPSRPGTGGTITLRIEFFAPDGIRLMYLDGSGEPFNEEFGGQNQSWIRVTDE